MKKLSVKTRRILAAVGGAAIVLALLLAADAVVGDPLSRAMARHSAVACAKRLYPGQTFVPDSDTIYYRPLAYETWVQSEQSPDTRFPVRTWAWLFTGDRCLSGSSQPSHDWYVEQKRNTCLRLEREAAEQLTALARKQHEEEIALCEENGCRPFVFMLCCDAPQKTEYDAAACTQNIEAWGGALAVDELFAPAVLQKTPVILTACRICPSGSVTEAEKEKALQEIKAFVEGEGWHADYYQIRFLYRHEEYGILAALETSDAVPAGEIRITGDL